MTSRVLVVLVVAAGACKERRPAGTAEPEHVTGARPTDAGASVAGDAGGTDPGPRRAIAVVTEPEALAAVEAAGGTLAGLLGAPDARDTEALAATSPRYRTIAEAIADDVTTASLTPGTGVGVRGNLHRLFDTTWLRSARTHFELVGIAPRLDRHAATRDCGDVRLVYRLAYATTSGGERVASRVPLTLSVSLAPRPGDTAGGCRADAAAWLAPEAVAGDPAALGRWLVSAGGPLGDAALDPARVVLVLSNLQVLRTPAASQPALGGHAEYRLRAFAPDEHGALARAPLENTPDIARIRGDATLRAELLAWLRDEATLDAIDRGVHRLPPSLLASSATSVSPYGLERPANRSFSALLDRRELASLPLAGRRTIASPEALLRRLDEQTCHGCHQVRSVAGFHLVGRDPPGTPAGTALAIAYSPLLADERTRRGLLIDALANGVPADFTRPPTPARVRAGRPAIGDACELGTIRPSSRAARLDVVANKRMLSCSPGLSCTRLRGGFPGGMCQAGCDALPEGAICGVIAVHPFNDCLGGGAPFSECMRHVRPIGLARCSDAEPCRDDYVCARTPAGDGACLPPYFLFQMRVDGHPP